MESPTNLCAGTQCVGWKASGGCAACATLARYYGGPFSHAGLSCDCDSMCVEPVRLLLLHCCLLSYSAFTAANAYAMYSPNPQPKKTDCM